MEAWEIWEESTDRGDPVKLAEVSDKSEELFKAYGRRPPSKDYPNGTGKPSPIARYFTVLRWLKAANLRSAIRLHRMVSEVGREILEGEPVSHSFFDEAMRALRRLKTLRVEDLSEIEMRQWENLLGDLQDEATMIRSELIALRGGGVRAANRRRR